MVPFGSGDPCHGPLPVLLYAHGTTPDRDFNIADLRGDPNAEGLAIAAVFASQGYIVVAPNYAGYDISTLTYHPYLVADQQSKDMIDALTAARSALPTAFAPTTTDGGRLFITGYSQGGYVAMATHRAMQAAGMTVTASAPMSGPYSLAAFVDSIFFGRVGTGETRSAALLFAGYQKSYGNVYGVRHRRLRGAVRGRHRVPAAEHDADEPAVRAGSAAARCVVQLDASGSGIRRRHSGHDAGQARADVRGGLRHRQPDHEQLPAELTCGMRRPIPTAGGRRPPAACPRRTPACACARC